MRLVLIPRSARYYDLISQRARLFGNPENRDCHGNPYSDQENSSSMHLGIMEEDCSPMPQSSYFS